MTDYPEKRSKTRRSDIDNADHRLGNWMLISIESRARRLFEMGMQAAK